MNVTLFGVFDYKAEKNKCRPPAEIFCKKYLEIDKTFNFGAFNATKPLTMKKLFAILALVGVLASSSLYGQDSARSRGAGERKNLQRPIPQPLLKMKTSLSMKY